MYELPRSSTRFGSKSNCPMTEKTSLICVVGSAGGAGSVESTASNFAYPSVSSRRILNFSCLKNSLVLHLHHEFEQEKLILNHYNHQGKKSI